MTDLKNPRIIFAKGFLFLGLGFLSGAMLVWELPSLRVGVLLLLTVWAFCRFYYFAFYVIEHYIDSEYRFDGLISFLRYFVSSNRKS